MALTDQVYLADTGSSGECDRMTARTSKSRPLGSFFIDCLSQRFPLSQGIRHCLFILMLLGLIGMFWRPLAEVASLTQTNEHYSHLILIPFVACYAFYVNRQTMLLSREWSPVAGITLLTLAVSVLVTSVSLVDERNSLSVSMLAWVISCWGAFVLLYGLRVSWSAGFALWILLFMVPLPPSALNAVIVFLQQSSAEITGMIFSLLGISVFRDGFVFVLSNFTIHIAHECSGIRSFLSLLITSIVAGHFFLQSAWGRLAIISFIVPLAIVKNAVRIVGLALLANYVDPTYITNSALHQSGGIPLFGVALGVLFAMIWLIQKIEKRYACYPQNLFPAKRKSYHGNRVFKMNQS